MNELILENIEIILSLVMLYVMAIITTIGSKVMKNLQVRTDSMKDENRNVKLKAVTDFVDQIIQTQFVVANNTLSKSEIQEYVVEQVCLLVSDSIQEYLEKEIVDDFENYVLTKVKSMM